MPNNVIQKVYNGGNEYLVAGGGSEGQEVVYLTQAEYDALPASKLTDGKIYKVKTSGSVPGGSDIIVPCGRTEDIPSNPEVGQMFFNTDDKNLLIYNGNHWDSVNKTPYYISGDYTLLRGPCDEGFHVPRYQERLSITNAGVDYVGYFKNYLHLSSWVGERGYSNGGWDTTSTITRYWTSAPYNNDARCLVIGSSGTVSFGDHPRAAGRPIRAFKDEPVTPDETWTETLTGKVWYNSTLGLISVLVGTNQYVTMQDKNVGATVVWNDGDALTNDNRGKYFQRGNNYGFTYGSTGDTSSTLVDASGYGPYTPYRRSSFITVQDSPYDWSSVKNDNLRGHVAFNS